MKGWLERNAKPIQSFATIATLCVALAALLGVKLQIDASARLQQEQSARDIYREFLNLSISKPEFADPDYCAIRPTPQAGAYENYVEYMLYTGEQLLATSPQWDETMFDHMAAHRDYLCTQSDWSDDSPQIQSMMARFKAKYCSAPVAKCAE